MSERTFDAEKGSAGSSLRGHTVTEISSCSPRSEDQIPLYDGDKINLIPMPTSDPKGKSLDQILHQYLTLA
jgi:hypothetical protein